MIVPYSSMYLNWYHTTKQNNSILSVFFKNTQNCSYNFPFLSSVFLYARKSILWNTILLNQKNNPLNFLRISSTAFSFWSQLTFKHCMIAWFLHIKHTLFNKKEQWRASTYIWDLWVSMWNTGLRHFKLSNSA